MNHSRHHSAHRRTARLGCWLPSDPKHLNEWLKKAVDAAESKKAPFRPVVEEFREEIENDPEMYMYFTQMFEQQPAFPVPPGSGDIKLQNCQQMLGVMNHLLTTAPDFNTTGMVGTPINAILDFPMITQAGFAAFLSPKVNAMFKKLLKVWGEYLDSPDSRYVLNTSEHGWLSPAALKALQLEDFIHDPKDPYFGFKSWNDFFTRQLKPGVRPVAEPDNDKVIVNACESAPFAISTEVKEHDTFWVKSQPYSLKHMLDGLFVGEFVGGTVYQAFLSADNYHRWHSPVSGRIKKIHHVDGTYYAEAPSEGFDPTGPNNSQGYIAHTATRALVFIEADGPIGLMCLVTVGMAEVSSCVVTVEENSKVRKGDQIGYFQFGGSTHCLVFRKGAISQFATQAIPQGPNGTNSTVVKVNSLLALASP
ncbi:MAG: phosphatidylserine decarboxylase family protein [Candidatus Korobacteraceae bacterium]